MHAFAVVREHEPLLLQHAPTKAAHGDGLQTVPAPRNVLVPVQPLAIRRVHEGDDPVPQQAPIRAAHGSGEQVVPAPWKVLEPVQAPSVVEVQTPELLQQAPSEQPIGLEHASPSATLSMKSPVLLLKPLTRM